MNVYKCTFTLADGSSVEAEIVTAMSLQEQYWTLTPGPNGTYSGSPGGNPPAPPLDTTPPSVPGALTVTLISASEIDLAWTASTDDTAVTGYLLERLAGAGAFSQIATPSGLTYQDLSLSASTSYSYRVRASDAAGNKSAYSNTASAVTQGSGPAADTTAPPAPTGMSIAAATTGLTVTFNPSSDPDVAAVWSGLLQGTTPKAYTLQREVGAGSFADLTTIQAPTKGLQYAPTDSAIGTAAAGAGTTRTGASYTIAGYGVGTSNQGKVGVDCRAVNPTDAVNSAGAPHIFANAKVVSGAVGDCMDFRTTQGGSSSNTPNVAAASARPKKGLSRAGDVFTQYASADGAGIGQASAAIGSQSIVLPATLWVGPAAGGSAYFGTADRGQLDSQQITGDFLATWTVTTCTNDGSLTHGQIDDFNITQDPALTYNDTTATTASTTYQYQAKVADGASNASAYSAAGSFTTPAASGGSGGGAAGIVALRNFINGLAGNTKHILVGQHERYWDGDPMDNVTPIPSLPGVNGKQVAILGTTNSWTGTDTGFVANSNAHLAKGGIVMVSQAPTNPLNGAAFTTVVTPGSAAYNTWHAFLDTQIAKFQQLIAPVIWRPFIELDGSWSWWSSDEGSHKDTFQTLWRQTHDYVESKMPGQILWLFSLNNFDTGASAWYPGNDVVDGIGFDQYPPSTAGLQSMYDWAVTTGKFIFMAEVGSNVNDSAVQVNTFDNHSIITTLKNSFPKIVGCMYWCFNQGLAQQKNPDLVLNDTACYALGDLPALYS